MMNLLATLGWGLLSLLALSVLVALWEFLRSTERQPWTGTPPAAQPAALDVDLAQLAGSDQREREAVLDSTLSRMGAALGGSTSIQAWSETRPMVNPGAPIEPGAPAERPRAEAPGTPG